MAKTRTGMCMYTCLNIVWAYKFVLQQLQECKDKNIQLENKVDRIEEKYKGQMDTLNMKIISILMQQQTIKRQTTLMKH